MSANSRFHSPARRVAGAWLVLSMLVTLWTPVALASPPAKDQVTAPAPAAVLPAWWMAPPPAPERAPELVPLLLPGGSTISGTLTADDV